MIPSTALLRLACVVLCAWSVWALGEVPLAQVKVENLRCEGAVNPLAVEAQPVLSWTIASEVRGVVQPGYHLLAATRPELLAPGAADLWESIAAKGTPRDQYAGKELSAGQRVFWKVRMEAGTAASAWSDPSEFTVGPLAGEDWTARWIAGAESAAGAPPPLPIFRKAFAVAKPVKRALAYVCGLGHFELSVNGQRVSDHFGDPGWTDYKDTCLYVPFDVTGMVRPGENALGVMLGNGMYNVVGGRYVKFSGSFGEPKLILQLELEYEDGSTERVVSDGTWRTAGGPITFSCVYGGEDYDARREQPGWDTSGFDGGAWTAARVVEGPGGKLRASEAPPVVVAETLKAARVEKKAPGEYFVDIGANLSARPWLKLEGPAGSQVVVRVGELADKPWEGHSYTYTLRGGGEEWLRPHFTYFGFQYVFITGVDVPGDVPADATRPQLLEVGADFVTSSAPAVGAFHCSNELLNDIDAMIDRSVRSNLQSVLTDCPHREKLGWLEVPHLMGPSIFYHYDAAGLYRKICRDTTEAQLENGMVPDIAPEYTRFTEGFFESAEWGSACVQIPWLLYTWYGDTGILERQFETMAKYTQYLASTRNNQGLAKAGLGDWYDWTEEKGHAGYSQLTPGELTAMAMLFDNARILGEAARLLDRAAESRNFKELSARVREDFLKAYYHPESQSVATGSQSALSVGLHFGLVPEGDRARVLENLVRAVETMQYRPNTGEVCFPFMIRALAEGGRSDVVYKIINRTDAPGYGCMLKQFGLKTLSEQWDKPGSSLNHCMFGHIQEWFQGYVLGIRQTAASVGWERVRIAPTVVGDLNAAEGHYDSPRGRIAVSWKKDGDNFGLEVTVPGNTMAEIVLPVAETARVTEGGTPLADSSAIQIGTRTANELTVVVGSGNYRFVAQPGST